MLVRRSAQPADASTKATDPAPAAASSVAASATTPAVPSHASIPAAAATRC